MAGVACLRSGVGLATVATPRSVLPTITGYAPELMTVPVAESDSGTITAEAVAQLDPLLKAMNVVPRTGHLAQSGDSIFCSAVRAAMLESRWSSMPMDSMLSPGTRRR